MDLSPEQVGPSSGITYELLHLDSLHCMCFLIDNCASALRRRAHSGPLLEVCHRALLEQLHSTMCDL